MELYCDILAHALTHGKIQLVFSNQETDLSKIVEGTCYQALKKIKAVIEDDSLDDPACFMRIEQIVCILEEIGSNGGNRHDFG